MKPSFAQILSRMEDELNARMRSKLPSWSGSRCIIPSELALQQCSSEQTASYKASLVGKGSTLTDLTGGMGVDSYAFSRVCSSVTYIERNPQLFDVARRNFSILGAGNIECRNEETSSAMSLGVYDWIFLDPSRRNSEGKKVFLMEQCSPDVVKLLPFLREHGRNIMLKLSPMADLKMLQERLGAELKEIHVVGCNGEVKEILCILRKDGGPAPCRIIIEELPLPPFEKKDGETSPIGIPMAGMTLFDPSATLKKAGMFDIGGMSKIGPCTHLFLGESSLPGRKYRILEVLPFGKASIEEFGKKYPRAEVSAKGIHLSSEQLRKRLKVSSGGNVHIFGAGAPQGDLLIAADS